MPDAAIPASSADKQELVPRLRVLPIDARIYAVFAMRRLCKRIGIALIACALLAPILAARSPCALATETVGSRSPEEVEAIGPWDSRVGHRRPVVAIVGLTAGTEVTDYLIPFAVLSQSRAAEVLALGTQRGPIQLMPALKIDPQTTIEQFDARFPEGADYVVVPAVHKPDDTALVGWVRSQAKKGAVVIGVCDGVWVVANAGLLSDHRATGHWYSLNRLEHTFGSTTWVRNQRYVADGSVVTTTGVTASIPVALALVEAIAGRERAGQVARELGASDWSPAHNSNDFKLNTAFVLTAARNQILFWSHEQVGIRLHPGIDEIALALVADAYSRTYRSQAVTVSNSQERVPTLRGLTLIPDVVADASKKQVRMLAPFDSMDPVRALDWALQGIADSYGESTAGFVALQMEYPARVSGRASDDTR